MSPPVELLLAWRYTRAERRGGFLSFITLIAILGVALGMVALITILSIMNGFELELRERLLGLSPHLTVRADTGTIANWREIQNTLTDLPAIQSVSPVIEHEAMITHYDQVQGLRLQGVLGATDPRASRIEETVTGQGVSALRAGAFQIILGEGLARALQVDPGDFVTLVSSKPVRTPAGLLPRLKRFHVIGILGAGVHEFDTAFAFIHLDDAGKLFRQATSITNLQLRVADPLSAPDLKPAIAEALRLQGDATDLRVYDWTDDNANLFKALKTEKIAMFVVLALAIAVAAFNLLSTLTMLVADKHGEIAVLRTLGLARRRIVLAFFAHGGVIGLTGVSLGAIGGIVLASNVAKVVAWLENTLGFKVLAPDVYYISDIPTHLEYFDVAVAIGVSLLLCLLAPLYPALSASRVDPAQVLRYE